MNVCTGCGACGADTAGRLPGDNYDVNPTISRVPAAAAAASTEAQVVWAWDRMQVEEKTNLYGRLLDNFNLHCEVDGYCFGDLFADDGWVCSVEKFSVDYAFPEFDDIFPGAAPIPGGGVPSGPACVAGMGSTAQADITAAFKPIYGIGGVFQTALHQPRHTVNNFAVTEQSATTMTTQHYQIIERAYHMGGKSISYDGSGYVVRLKWKKVGTGYAGIWQITEMVEVHNGDGHLGIPSAENPDMTAAHLAFVNGWRVAGGQEAFTGPGRKLSGWKAPKRKLQAAALYGNFDPTLTRIPAMSTLEEAVALAWDHQDILEHISMYSWLADETRVNSLQGFAWGDMFADNSNFCIYPAGDSFDMPSFDNYVQGEHYLGRPFVGGGCAPGSILNGDANTPCINTCSSGQGDGAQNNMQSMIHGTFGTGGATQTRHQQTRHTLTNKIFLEQTATTATVQYTNTLQRYISGVAYDSSIFIYQAKLIKDAGRWKYSGINAFSQGHGPLGEGLPGDEWVPYITAANDYVGSVGVTERGRKLGVAVTTGTIAGDVVAPNIQLNPKVSRIPSGALSAMQSGDVATASSMLWDRLAIMERLNLYPWLADETRRNEPMGYRWGDLHDEGSYFCMCPSFNVTEVRAPFSVLVPGYAGCFGAPVPAATAPGTGAASTCSSDLGAFAPAAMQGMITGTFGPGGVMQTNKQQTRHTFSNHAFLMQTSTTATTLNYNIVERFVWDGSKSVALDGSNFIYRAHWFKVGGLWKMRGMSTHIIGHDRIGTAPNPEAMTSWLDYLASPPFQV